MRIQAGLLLMAISAAPLFAADNAAVPEIPVEPYRPLSGIQIPAEIPEKSRVLRHEEIWELPDTMRREIQGQFITINYEQTRIVHEVIIAGKDAGTVGKWQELYDDETQRMIAVEGVIRPPGGQPAPLDPKIHLLEKAARSRQLGDKKAEAEGKPRKRLWWVIVPGITPGTVLDIRSVMHYDNLQYVSRGFADGPLAVDHFRLLVRSNKKLYTRHPGFWSSFMGITPSREKLKLEFRRDADFAPRGSHGFWVKKIDRWWADIYLLAHGSNLRKGGEHDSPDRHETELLADDLPAQEHEPVQPDDDLVRPLALAYYSSVAPSANLDYWEKSQPEFHQEQLKKFLGNCPAAKDFNAEAALGTEPGDARIAHLAGWLEKKFMEVAGAKLRSCRDTLKTMNGPWYARYYLLAKLLRDAGVPSELAFVFNSDDLPVVPELTDNHFYAGPYLAVRVEAASGVEYFFPGVDAYTGGRCPPWNRGAVAYVFWDHGPARRELVPRRAPVDDSEVFNLKGAIAGDGRLTGEMTGRFAGFTAQRARGRLKREPLVIEIKPEEMGDMEEVIRKRREAAGDLASASVEEYLKQRFGGVFTAGKTQNYSKPGTPVTLSSSVAEDNYAAGMLPLLGKNLGLEALYTRKERRYPVRDSLPESHRFEFDLALPEGKKPAPTVLDETVEGPGGYRFTAQAKFADGHWIGVWSLVETWGEVAPADYPKLRAAEEKAMELLNRKIPLVAAR